MTTLRFKKSGEPRITPNGIFQSWACVNCGETIEINVTFPRILTVEDDIQKERCEECGSVPKDNHMPFVLDDGGRAAAGYKGTARDCVTRAIAIATQRPYQEVYDAINELGTQERTRYRKTFIGEHLVKFPISNSTARGGVLKDTLRKYMKSIGWEWVPTMKVGSGCTTHLQKGELPMGRLVVSVSHHSVAVIDGVIHDTHDPSRNGTRCVYGYYKEKL